MSAAVVQSETREVAFDKAPAYPEGLLAVRGGMDPQWAMVHARIILGFLRDRNRTLVGGEDEAAEDEHYVHAMLLDLAMALYESAGAVG